MTIIRLRLKYKMKLVRWIKLKIKNLLNVPKKNMTNNKTISIKIQKTLLRVPQIQPKDQDHNTKNTNNKQFILLKLKNKQFKYKTR